MNDQQQSRADALTIPRDLLNDLIDDVQSFADQVPCREREKAFRADLLARARAIAAFPVEQPALLTAQDALAAIETFEIVGDNNDSREPNAEDRFILTEFVAHLFGGFRVELPAAAPADGACNRCGSTTAQACNDAGCFYLESGDGEPSAAPADERAAQNKGYFVYDPEGYGFELYATDAERAEAHNTAIEECRQAAIDDDEWSLEMESIVSGIVTHRTVATQVDGDSCDYEARAAASPAAEPIAWLVTSKRGLVRTVWTTKPDDEKLAVCAADEDTVTPLYAAPQPAQADAPAEAREPQWCADIIADLQGLFDTEGITENDSGDALIRLSDAIEAVENAKSSAPADAGEAAAWRYRTSGDNWCYCDGDPVHVCDRDYEKQPLYTAQPAARVARLTDAARDMLAERRRQVEAEGWTPKHDDEHDKGEMARAAACYALHAGSCFAWRADAYQSAKPHEGNPAAQDSLWPWDMQWWKPTTPRRDLVKAGALILAELERLDRAALLNGDDHDR